MKNTITLLLIFLSIPFTMLGGVNSSYSVFVQPKTMTSGSVAPFDVKGWYLYVPIDSTLGAKDVIQISVIQLKKKDNLDMHTTNSYQNLADNSIRTDTDFKYIFCYYASPPVEKSLTFTEENDLSKFCTDTTYPGPGPYKYLKIVMQAIPSGTHFRVIIFTKLNSNEINTLTVLGYSNYQQREKRYNALAAKYKSSHATQLPSSTIYEQIYRQYLKQNYDSLKADNPDLSKAFNDFITEMQKTSGTPAQSLLGQLAECLCKLQASDKKNDSAIYAMLIPLKNLTLLQHDKLDAVPIGLWDITGNILDTLVAKSELDKRIRNLKKLNSFLRDLHQYLLTNCCTQQHTLNELDALSYKIDPYINKLLNRQQAVQDDLGKLPGFNYQSLDNNSTIKDIKSSSGYYLIPDIGLGNIFSVLRSPGGTLQYKNFVRPYYGVNISFVPVNKNVELRDLKSYYKYNKAYRIAHYFSATVGLTAIPINRPDASDLIKGMSLVTGLGIRPYKWVRFTLGDMLYLANNLNPVKNPVPAFAPFVGFSIDADLLYAIQTFTGKLYP